MGDEVTAREVAADKVRRQLFDLSGARVVVTGAASGLGLAMAEVTADCGATVVMADRDVEALEPARARLAARGLLVDARQVDVADGAAVDALFAAVSAQHGGVDVVFANAGIQAMAGLLEMSDADWQDQIDVNLNGTANMLRVFAPLLVERGAGRIIVTSSTQGQHGMKYGSAYSASKWGLIGLAKSAALELGAHDITVNALIPGLINTTLTRHESRYATAIRSAGKQPSGDEEEDERRAVDVRQKKVPLDVPWLEPEDVAPTVVFLASDQARMVSGTTFAVTGGDSAHVTA